MPSEICKFHMRILGAALLPPVGGCLGACVVRKHVSPWYTGLKKPSWTPPDYAFGPIRGIIHTGIGFASYLVYRDGDGFSGPAKLPLIMYGAHLALNLSWAPLFFYLKNLDFGFWGIKLVTVTGIMTAHAFYRVNKN
ncbi:hypothetical protein AMK59_6669, partial [Oryctes borbonicus]